MVTSDQARRASVGARMVIDHWTVRTVAALTAGRVDCVLLKGPVIARWLYDDPLERDYADADLLVRTSQLPEARVVLTELGFLPLDAPMTSPWETAAHAEEWSGASGHARVDLHRCLHGLERVPAEPVFEAIWRDPDHLRLQDTDLVVPPEPWRLLHLVLHLQPKDHAGSQAWIDVERALDRFEVDDWRPAAALADQFGILDTMGPLLRLVPGGAAVADVLGLPVEPARSLVIHHRRNAPGLVRFGYRLRAVGVAGAPHVLRTAIAPSPPYVRASYAVARRGRLGLTAAYAWRIIRLPAVVVRAVRHQSTTRGRRLR